MRQGARAGRPVAPGQRPNWRRPLELQGRVRAHGRQGPAGRLRVVEWAAGLAVRPVNWARGAAKQIGIPGARAGDAGRVIAMRESVAVSEQRQGRRHWAQLEDKIAVNEISFGQPAGPRARPGGGAVARWR